VRPKQAGVRAAALARGDGAWAAMPALPPVETSGGMRRSVSESMLPDSPNRDRNPGLGRGGLMGPSFHIPGQQFSPFVEKVRVYVMTSLWLLIIVEFFAGLVLLLPLKLLGSPGQKAYARCALWWDWFSQGAILAVPFSWCGLTMHIAGVDVAMRSKAAGSSLWMSNHGSRIDWLCGLMMGYVAKDDGPRVHVRFIAEITTALMPLAGWSRFLLDDVYLRRTFHRDAVNIRAKLAGYREVPAPRMLFFAPEGAIADVGNAKDAQYIDACEAFMRELGRKPLTFLLTPRYKGLSVFAEHSPTNIISAMMAFVQPTKPFARDMAVDGDGSIVGGSLCSLPLRDNERVVPDIHTVFGGGLQVFIQLKKIDIPRSEEAGSTALRDRLLDDYARKDDELSMFMAQRKYSNVHTRDDWETIVCPHLTMNLTIVAYAIIGVNGVSLIWGLDTYGAIRHCATTWLFMVVLHACSHALGVIISGHHRESLPGETAFKTILETVKGGLNHGGTTREKSE